MKLKDQLALKYLRARLNILALASERKAAEKAFEIFCTPRKKSRKKWPEVFESAERISFEQDGKTIRGYRWNHPRAHRVLLLHGFESSARNFGRFVEPLLEKGYEVLAFDAPAHGKSDGKRMVLPDYVRMLELVHEHYGPMRGFLAHSFGGLALSLFLEKQVPDENTRVVFIAPATETKTSIELFFNLLQLQPGIRQEFLQLIREKGGVDASWYSIRRAIAAIHAPLLWIHDLKDSITPWADAEKIQATGQPNISWITTTGLGHRKIYRDPEIIRKAIDFL